MGTAIPTINGTGPSDTAEICPTRGTLARFNHFKGLQARINPSVIPWAPNPEHICTTKRHTGPANCRSSKVDNTPVAMASFSSKYPGGSGGQSPPAGRVAQAIRNRLRGSENQPHHEVGYEAFTAPSPAPRRMNRPDRTLRDPCPHSAPPSQRVALRAWGVVRVERRGRRPQSESSATPGGERSEPRRRMRGTACLSERLKQ